MWFSSSKFQALLFWGTCSKYIKYVLIYLYIIYFPGGPVLLITDKSLSEAEGLSGGKDNLLNLIRALHWTKV